MALTGIIAEFNPMHTGHKRLIDFAKKDGGTAVCVLSGNFVQRGDIAVLSKQKRAMAALVCGADIVAELPVLWSMSTAQNFALGGVWQTYNLGCERIVFGSECGDINLLLDTANILLSDKFSTLVAEEVKSGITFALARQNAAEKLGVRSDILKNPNDNLGLEYIIAAKKLNLPITFDCLKREGALHGDTEEKENSVSSTYLRQKLLDGKIGYAERFMPTALRGLINERDIADISRIERTLLGILRLKEKEDFLCVPDMAEGLENKLYFSLRVAKSLDELYNMIKSKRYTHSRIRRLVLNSALGFDNGFFMRTPPYTRVLGFSKKGEDAIKSGASLNPVVFRAGDFKLLDEDSKKVFECECRATDLYALAFDTPRECGGEYKYKLMKTECLKW